MPGPEKPDTLREARRSELCQLTITARGRANEARSNVDVVLVKRANLKSQTNRQPNCGTEDRGCGEVGQGGPPRIARVIRYQTVTPVRPNQAAIQLKGFRLRLGAIAG